MKRFVLAPFSLSLWLALACLLLMSVPALGAQNAAGSTITMAGPAACPPGGCAAGQRMTYQLDFELGAYNAARTDTNVKVCVYLPANWYDAPSVDLDTNGGISGNTYNNVGGTTGCPEDLTPPTGYQLAVAAETGFNGIFAFHDSLGLSFRFAATASTPGSVLMRVFELTDDGTPAGKWVRSAQVFTSPMTPLAPAAVMYIAGDPASCTSNPCYLNSGGDKAGGIGTGLKDAVDAAAAGARLVVLGPVALKGSTVQINKQLTIEGSGDAALTNSGSVCTNPLLEMTAGGALRGLGLSDGSCSTPDRTLLSVNSPADITIESNDFSGGGDAIHVADNSGGLTVRYNQIQGNSGYALFWDGNTKKGSLNLQANNILQNRPGIAVECSAGASAPEANRRIDHNFWGGPAAPSAASTHCSISPNRQLGAAILGNTTTPGLNVERVTVTTTKAYRFNNLIAFQRSAEGGDFDLYIVNHGGTSPDAIPFTTGFVGSPNPCSNYWDVFLAEGAAPGGSLTLSFKYSRTTACTAAIESSQFCEVATNTAKFPLWWDEPSGQITNGWDTTGQNPAGAGAGGVTGQATTCDMVNDEIRVVIDNTGRPSLANDLNYIPFMVGLPVPSTFIALASNQTVTLRWSTTTEADLSGYYILRGNAPSGPFDPISDLIVRKGSALAGGDYAFADGGRTNGVINYYRLKIVRTDASFFYSDILSVIPNTPTVTPTLTPSLTFTLVPTRTATIRVPTATRAPTITRVSTATRVSLIPSPTRTGTRVTPSPTQLITGTASTKTPGPSPTAPAAGTALPPAQLTASAQASSSVEIITLTPSVTPSQQPSPTASLTPTTPANPEGRSRNASDWISLVLGLLLSGGVIFGLTWLFYLRRKPQD